MDNREIAKRLTHEAHVLESERGSLYRVVAYRRAAETILGLDEPVEEIVLRAGRKGLRSLPGIGRHLSLAIENLVRTGEIHTLNSRSGFRASRSQPGKADLQGRAHAAKRASVA